MEGKSGPPEERRIAHEKKKKEKRKGNSGPSGSRESHAEAKLRIRNPDDLPPMCRRENAHSTTTPDSSPMRGRTKGKKEGCGHRNDGVFTPKQRARQLQQNFARGILSACIRPSQRTYRTEPPSPPPRQRMPENNNFVRLPAQTGARFVRRPQRRGDDFLHAKGKKKPNTFDISPLLKNKNKKPRSLLEKKNS